MTFKAINACTTNTLPHYFPYPILPYLCDLPSTVFSPIDSIPPKTTSLLSAFSQTTLAHLLWLLQNRTLFSQMSANMFTSLFTSLFKSHPPERATLIAYLILLPHHQFPIPLYPDLLFPRTLRKFSNIQSNLFCITFTIYCLILPLEYSFFQGKANCFIH